MFLKYVKIHFVVFLHRTMMTCVVKEFGVCPSFYKP
ncbi:hypothetical protein KPGFFKBI_02752 [[Clostridium] scindens]|nr:hypothetical protein CLBADJHJ_02598 [[Clostridium] scindens]WPB34797.1 hypothetical protein HCEICBPK_03584 [[Clostridium] scindens]WPB48808.1 hypothetical protein KPGFFKBI_02752 [[Clostridium] scindens]